MRQVIALSILAAVGFTASVATAAFPERPITLVVSYPPGGTTDIVARQLAQKMSDELKSPVIVENKPGANSFIGTSFVARAPKDGYTLLLAGPSAFVTGPHLYPNMNFSIKDFEPISLVTRVPFLVLANKEKGAGSLKEFIEQSKARPDGFNIGVAGAGSVSHVAAEVFKQETGAKLTVIPYQGAAQLQTAVIGGTIDASIDGAPGALPHYRAGTVEVLGILNEKRLPTLPNVPTLPEQGFERAVVSTWFGIMVPAGTPAPVVKRLSEALRAALANPDLVAAYAKAGLTVNPSSAFEFAEMISQEKEKQGAVIRRANIVVKN